MIAAILICIGVFFPIGEKDMLEPENRWPERKRVDNDTLRELILRNTGYADSVGRIDKRIRVWLLSECEGDTAYSLLMVNGIDGDRDDALWLVLRSGNAILSRTMVAALQTTCESTFLRGSRVIESDIIEMQQLTHVFDCADDKFLRTDTLTSVRVRIHSDRIEDILE